MRVSRLKTNLLLSFLLLTLFSIPITVRAQEAATDDDEDYDVKARVVRISLLGGEVTLKRNGNKDFEVARLNYPLVEGDTIATGKASYLEVQIDSRNFIRLAPDSVFRFITLRDEGIAISVVEGSVSVRLAKFDRKNGYFEIDAPKTTMAAEKDGLYRVDVPPQGRVRLTVRDGGSARIYSDTSGFSLRDGRSAELVITGDTAGDWDLLAAAPRDSIDDWVIDRERQIAQRSKYDNKYFDEYVWGGEDLQSYGDWINTDTYGWLWRPHTSVISTYADWAPYRYGQWTWCPPYGWTWVGYEPWGWAPYHYGRWVFHNGYWAWVPRSTFYRNRSWWRPALVAFSFSFGNDICWYPLDYYQHDPYSRHYRHYDRNRDRDRDRHRGGYGRPGDSGGSRDGRGRYDDPRHWRGVTGVPRRDFGNPQRRGRAVEEPVARRVMESEPEKADLPANREGLVRLPVRQIPTRPTGAAERAPGVPLDEDLRRNRVFRGREPRASEPRGSEAGQTTTTNTNPTTQPSTPPATPPTGAVARPDPRPGRVEPREGEPGRSDPPRGRLVRPTLPEGEKRGRSQQAIENVPSAPREPRTEQATPPPAEAPSAPPRVERREREAPVTNPDSTPEPRPERQPRPDPRPEPREARPEPARESPRNEAPRVETPRPEPPRSEPRSEPRESRPEPRPESPRNEAPRSEPPRSESPRPEPPRSEPPRSEPRHEAPRSEPPRSEPPRSEPPRSEAPRSEPPRSESPRSESPRQEAPRSAPDRPRPDRPTL